jgi:hypothetical protein
MQTQITSSVIFFRRGNRSEEGNHDVGGDLVNNGARLCGAVGFIPETLSKQPLLPTNDAIRRHIGLRFGLRADESIATPNGHLVDGMGDAVDRLRIPAHWARRPYCYKLKHGVRRNRFAARSLLGWLSVLLSSTLLSLYAIENPQLQMWPGRVAAVIVASIFLTITLPISPLYLDSLTVRNAN